MFKHLINKRGPAQFGVGFGLAGRHGECRIQQQNPLVSPVIKAGFVPCLTKVSFNFFEDIAQTVQAPAKFNRDRKRQAVGLSGGVVRVLADDDHTCVIWLGLFKCCKGQRRWRQYIRIQLVRYAGQVIGEKWKIAPRAEAAEVKHLILVALLE